MRVGSNWAIVAVVAPRTHRWGAAWLVAGWLVLAAVGCRSRSAPPPSNGTGDRREASAAPSPTAASPARRDGGRDGADPASGEGELPVTSEALAAAKKLEMARCRTDDCCATRIWPLGRDHRGRQLAVVALRTHSECLLPQPPRKTRSRSAAPEDEEQDDDKHACAAYWLVDVAAPKRPWIRQLRRQCEEDMRDVDAAVDARTMTFSFGDRSMYTANQSSDTTVIGLDPLRLVETSHTSARDDEHTTTWNWDDFADTVENGRNYCEGKRPRDAGARDPESDHADVEAQAVLIPEVSLPPAFLAGGWKTTGLGRCAARVGGDRGFTVHGAKGTASDSSMRAVFASASELFIEVTDDRFVTGAKTWVKDDHVEIWAAAPDHSCVDPGEKPSARQWGIRVTDGEVFAGFGAPTAMPRVEVARAGNVIRLRVTFEADTLPGPWFTAVYSDSDDGVRQKRLIATSALVFGQWWTFGDGPDGEQSKSCTVARGVLEPRAPPLPDF